MSLRTMLQGFRRGVAQWEGIGGRGGAPELIGRARGGQWLQERRAAVTAALGQEGKGEQRRGGGRGRVIGSRGRSGDARGARGSLQQRRASRRWPDACSRAPATRSSSWKGERRQGGAPGGLGRPATVLGRLVASGKFLCSVLSLFSIFL